jgi:hypothetical protein
MGTGYQEIMLSLVFDLQSQAGSVAMIIQRGGNHAKYIKTITSRVAYPLFAYSPVQSIYSHFSSGYSSDMDDWTAATTARSFFKIVLISRVRSDAVFACAPM